MGRDTAWRTPSIPPVGAAIDVAGDGRRPPEVLAGITLAALSLPLNIGYASAAGLPATVGIYATLIPLVVFALATGSRHLMVGPDATIAALLAAVVGPVVAGGTDPAEVASAMALCVGTVLLAFWLFRLGGLVRFVSKAVLVGFIAGLGVEVLTSQVKKMMAVDVEADGWVREVVALADAVPDVSWASVAVGAGTVVGLRALARVAPRLPGALVVLVTATALVAMIDPAEVSVLGDIPSGLPTPTVPTVGLDVWLDLASVSLAIAVLVTAEGLLLAQRYARRHGEALDANGEVFSLGLSNVTSALTGGMPIGASPSRTAAMADARTRTQVPTVVAAVVVAVVLLFFTDLVGRLPDAALAGLVANAVVSTIEVSELRRFARLRRSELAIAAVCGAGVLLIGPIAGIVLAVIMSAIDVVRRAAASPWSELATSTDGTDPDLGRALKVRTSEDRTDGLLLLRPGGSLFFANSDETRAVVERAGQAPGVRWVVIDVETVGDIDPTAAEALLEGIRGAHGTGTVVAFARATERISELLDRYGITAVVGPDRFYPSNRAAMAAFERAEGEEQP